MPNKRSVWLIVNGSQLEVGYLEKNYTQLRLRTIQTRPFKRLNGFDGRFKLFEDLMRSRGYEPIIYEDGRIVIQLPISDRYGPVLREIANVYYLAEKMEAAQ